MRFWTCQEQEKTDAMPQFVRRDFWHRRNHDGAVDSICMRCLISVGTEGTETQLGEAENAHICPGFNLSRILHPEAHLRYRAGYNEELAPDRGGHFQQRGLARMILDRVVR
jgi:hypothetical protein